MADNYIDPRTLTFSQAQGYEPLPGPLALEELSDEARLQLWDLLFVNLFSSDAKVGLSRRVLFEQNDVLRTLHRDFRRKPADEFKGPEATPYKSTILDEYFADVFDLLQIIMRHPKCPVEFAKAVADVFERCRLAYVVDTADPATILPAATKKEGQAIIRAIQEFREAGLEGTAVHLRKGAELINSGDWGGAVRESIHAVESIARQLSPDSNTLEPALKSLERDQQLHPALREAFSKLYGYTSDEQGIRHALIDREDSPAGQDEAMFMLGACASFSTYLWRKHQRGVRDGV